MKKSKATKRTRLSRAATVKEIGEYWGSHSLDNRWGEGHDVAFEIRAQRRVMLSPDLHARLAKEARVRGITTETLVNLWLAERLKLPERVAESADRRHG